MDDDRHRQLDIAEDAVGDRWDRAIAKASGLSRERVKALLQSGAIRALDDAPLTASGKVAAPVRLILDIPPPVPLNARAEDIALTIVHEDDDLIVVDKPAGLVVHPAAGHAEGTLVNALLHHCAGRLSGIGGVERPGIVHRIDKDTSGLLVVAKSDVAHEGLARQFADHSLERAYLAVVAGLPLPRQGTVDAPLGRSQHDRKKIAVQPADRGKRAVTHYRVVEPLRGAALVECRLETGRTHQVRVHMSHIGHPLVGDPTYGRVEKPLRETLARIGFARQALHATTLGFIHPVSGARMSFTSGFPGDMQALLSALRS